MGVALRPTDPLVLRYIEELKARGLERDIDLIIPSSEVFEIGERFAEAHRSYAELLNELANYVKPRINVDVANSVVGEYLGGANVDAVDILAKRLAKWYIDILRLFNVIQFSGFQPPSE